MQQVDLLKKSEAIFSIFYHDNPSPFTELEYSTLFELLVAVSLSAQTTDKSVNIATKKLFKVANTPEAIFLLGEDAVRTLIKNVGLYNVKSKNLIKLSHILVDQYNSSVPLRIDELVKLPGVGRKTANVVINCWTNNPTMPVDTHVFRVTRRLGLAYSMNPVSVEKELLKNIPEKWLSKAHHWLVLHGRYICKARRPDCQKCFLKDHCDFFASLQA
ncbi:MAG: endonuclease III [Rickettsiaceae bacterium]|nr:endonuclease III [Rickettsiaceae bacterium]